MPLTALGSILISFIRLGTTFSGDSPAFYVVFILFTICLTLARLVTDTALNDARANAQRTVAALKITEAQAQQLEAANQQQQTQLAAQQRLLDLVTTLETPAVTLAEGVLFVPIVGYLDSRRAQTLTTRLLDAAYTQRARLVILDITGVLAVDSATARALLDTAQALQLLGCAVTICGISAAVAHTLTVQDVRLAGVSTVRSPQEALAQAAS